MDWHCTIDVKALSLPPPLCKQFRLPPPGVAIPAPRVSAAIAGNTPVVDTLVLTSVWAVQVLRALCQVRGRLSGS